MPTLLRWKGFRFFFYSADVWEPPHIHVYKNGNEAKIWLNDLTVAASYGYNARELNEIAGVVREHRADFMKAWNDHFSSRNQR